MTCRDCLPQLTAYLDGELTDDRGAMVRGHLRVCPECQAVAQHEALIRDGLRALPSAEPPAHLWAAIAAEVAQQEVALAKQSFGQRMLRRARAWGHAGLAALALPQLGRVGRWTVGGTAVLAATALLWWKIAQPGANLPGSPGPTGAEVVTVPTLAPVGATQLVPAMPIERNEVVLPAHGLALPGDVTAELAAEQRAVDETYASAVAELQAEVAKTSVNWSPAALAAFTKRNTELASGIANAQGRARARAYQMQLRFLQTAVVEQVASIEGVQ